jgi:hypothetical protein
MVATPKITERAADLAAQAAAAAGPLAAQARERATELAAQAAAAAGPLTVQARERAAQGVEVLADNLAKLAGGKYADQIGAVSTKLGQALDPKTHPQP